MMGSAGPLQRASLALASLVVIATLTLAACGGSSTTASNSAGDTAPEAAAQKDRALEAWPKADEAMKQVADDAVLLSMGNSGGLALADVPDSWSFTFFSPSKNHVYSVSVEHGTAQAASDLGEAKANTEVRTATEIASVKVGAAEAVVKARAFGEKSGVVPKNVMVAGQFAEMPLSADSGFKTGVWTVTFASGTDLADAMKFEVDMMSGAVTAVEK